MPAEAPSSLEGRLLWEIGKTVHHYLDRVFEAGILYPFKEQENDAPERTP